MNKENRITINNLVYAILFLVFGIILLTSTEDLISIVSKVIGVGLIILGIVKSIVYIYLKGKLGEYSIMELLIGLIVICCGGLLIFSSNALSFAIRTIVGIWVLFAGINRIIYAISIRPLDKQGFLTYLISSFVMIIIGILMISAIFDQLIGLLIIIYAISEIVDYIYYKSKNKNIESVKPRNRTKKTKKIKNAKTVDAIIEEAKKD